MTEVRTPEASGQRTSPRRRWPYVAGTLVIVIGMFASLFWGSDDAFPLAPYRMFSYANSPDGVVRVLRFEADLESGEHVRLPSDVIGLRRAELEGQTRFNKRVPDHKLAAIARVYNERHEDDMVHLQVVARGVRLRDGKPQPGEELVVIGDWADERWEGPRVEVDLPLGEDIPGYRR